MDRISNCKIITIKHGIIHPAKEEKDYYRSVTGREYNKVKRATSVFIIEHTRGQCFTAIQWCKSGFVDIAARGLQTYNIDGSNLSDGAIQRREMLQEVLNDVAWFYITRVDYAIDLPKIPSKYMRKIREKRTLKPYKNSRYYQTYKQRVAENSYLKIFIYNKALKDGLPSPKERLEFALKSKYWPKDLIQIDQLDEVIINVGEKVLQKWIEEKVECVPLIGPHTHMRVSTTEKQSNETSLVPSI